MFIDGQPTIIFDTICTKNREPWLANEEVHLLLRSVWEQANAWQIGHYTIMPDHIHLFATPTEPYIEYGKWVTYWKSMFSKKHGNPKHRWLSDQWDTRMRSAKQFEDKWEYVRWNAVRHGLVKAPEDWPYQGEIHELRWDGV